MKCCLNCVFIKFLDVSSPEKVGKVSFGDVSSIFLLKLVNLFSPAFFHFTQADNIETLEGMSAVGGVPEDDDDVIACVVEELRSVMQAITVKEEDPGPAICFHPGFVVKYLFKPCPS